jgi:DNA-binding SARP family transcriptional activator
MTVWVSLLGRPRMKVDGEQPYPQPRGRKSWAVLARVALADLPLSRRQLAEELFAETDDPLAALRWCLADLRRALGLPGLLRGNSLVLGPNEAGPNGMWLDVWALADGTLPPAQIGGALLEGIELRDCPEFDLWLLIARTQWAVRSLEELRQGALRCLTGGDAAAASSLAQRAVQLDWRDESAQELFLRALVADGRAGVARAHLAAYEGSCAAEGLCISPALRDASRDRSEQPVGLRAGVLASSLLAAGTAALAAGAADGGIETLRRAADAAAGADSPLQADVFLALGSALVHAVRGFDGEGAVVLHQALRAARAADNPTVAAESLRELAFVDLQAGRHDSAVKALAQARRAAADSDNPALNARLLALEGMNAADCGRHRRAIDLLQRSVDAARETDDSRQQIWSQGVLARSLLLAGDKNQARLAAELSIAGARAQRWNAFLPWPQAIRAECLAAEGRWEEAQDDAEQSFALGCELGDPCWEGMAGRALSVIALHAGDYDSARRWIIDARHRCDRVSDRYVWVSAYVGLAQLELAAKVDTGLVPVLAQRLRDYASRVDLPEFLAWALLHQAQSGAPVSMGAVRRVAHSIDNPDLHARIGELTVRCQP